ncbi:YjjG family noncanonical pyrimidine nucleotidase [Streptococcus sp. DD13]|uniref:YjjG family noncanonical pyrimidine nucleotidase n=1 Tax=Streptococcus sp. DD13 TaxID=1777881 RepID=UPI000834B76C|nr:YjjG family noncanonical pyrimidine nucleotidase [Streptococcus sp. DD13]
MSYKYLLFDLDHTLLDFDAAEDIALTQLLKEQGVSEIQAYKDFYIPMNKGLWRDLEQGKIRKKDLVNSRFARLFAHFGIEKDGVELAERYQDFLSCQGQTYPGASNLLAILKEQGYELFAATNGIATIQKGRIANSDISSYFKQLFISEELGSQKPHPLFYERLAMCIPDFDKSSALMIGDSLTADIAGGNQAGIDSVWYNPNHLHNTSQALPTYQVASYDELLKLLAS